MYVLWFSYTYFRMFNALFIATHLSHTVAVTFAVWGGDSKSSPRFFYLLHSFTEDSILAT